MKNKNLFIVGGLIFIIALLIFFGRAGEGSPTITNNSEIKFSDQSASVQSGGDQSVQYAPDFTLTKLDGTELTLSDYRGEKPVILDFFATWCPNCKRDMPKLSRWYEKYNNDIEVIGVNLHEREKTVLQYIEKANIAFPIVLDPRSSVAKAYGVQFTNYHVLINTDGTVALTVPGDISESHIISLIEAN